MEFPRTTLVLTTLAVVGLLHQGVGGTKEMGPKPKLPDDTLFKDPAAFCEGCYALIHEANKLLTKWQKEKGSLEEHIDAALLATCSTDRLRSYVLSPPKMMRLCSGIRAHYEDDLGMAFLKHYSKKEIPSADKLFQDTCQRVIPACPRGVQPMTVARKFTVEDFQGCLHTWQTRGDTWVSSEAD
ncbi:uncharacterized protein [Panulirus ornatus]|uniref:uncharacterized protein isoform X2 n=1 Tax=Panulirus ornatus TaxID=150431 RepID=UPI003A84B594